MPDQLKPAGGPPDDVAIAIHAWNLCGGMEWSAIPIVADVLGIRDVERLIHQLVAIRDRHNREH